MEYGTKEYFKTLTKEQLHKESEKLLKKVYEKSTTITKNYIYKTYTNRIKSDNQLSTKIQCINLVADTFESYAKSLKRLQKYLENLQDVYNKKFNQEVKQNERFN